MTIKVNLRHAIIATAALCALSLNARTVSRSVNSQGDTVYINAVGPNAYRVTITPKGAKPVNNAFYLPYQEYSGHTVGNISADQSQIVLTLPTGEKVVQSAYTLTPNSETDTNWACSVTFTSPDDESLYGTGQFQDGYLDIKGLTRRLTQVNTQISVPMVISSAGYGVLWNNCGLTEFNPCDHSVALSPVDAASSVTQVDVTSSTGNAREVRRSGEFETTITIDADGEYALMLDCGQTMARKHYLAVDGKVLTQADNVWLPPTTSAKTYLTKGEHKVTVKGENNDHPTLYWRKIDGTTSWASPVSQGVDYTIFVGTPDQIVAQMRQLTGEVPMLPKWALGYIHCRERYNTQDELLANAREFRERGIPIDMIVQDWQWWGDYGWNAMRFDEKKYPDPIAMTDSLHAMDMRIMLSVWAKVDKNSTLGKEMEAKGYYIPGSDWIDFFNPEAAEAYWQAYHDNLLPTGIDAWWQDATEPENDDLHGRTVAAGTVSGDAVRNVFPIAVNDRVYRGLCESRPEQRPMILTRCGAPGIQRYGVVTWSGDVGNDMETLRRQLAGGLGQMATGLPWWTYDAGGFFRPGNQYTDSVYQRRMLRWIQHSVFLPLMRVHGYMSQTEPWRYSQQTYDDFRNLIELRYMFVPYLYSEAYKVSTQGSTLMRPMVFDYASDPQALGDNLQYMLGESLLVCPITEETDSVDIYLPETKGGWYNFSDFAKHYAPGCHHLPTPQDIIPVFIKAGAIFPTIDTKQLRSTTDLTNAEEVTLLVFPGADGEFTLYDDDGVSNAYKEGKYSLLHLKWDDSARCLTLDAEDTPYDSPVKRYNIYIVDRGDEYVIDSSCRHHEIFF